MKKYTQRYLVVRFEDMVNDPEKTLKAVCAFLDEDYDTKMLSMDGALEQREKMIHRSHGDLSRSPLSPDYIGIHRDQISDVELAFLQFALRRRMLANRYKLEPVHLSARQWLEFFIKTLPLNLARMTAWIVLETAQHHFPSIFGRKPDARMRVEPPSQPVTLAESER